MFWRATTPRAAPWTSSPRTSGSSPTWPAPTTFPVPVASSALQLFLMTAAAGMGRDDDASVARLFAKVAGIDLPTKEG